MSEANRRTEAWQKKALRKDGVVTRRIKTGHLYKAASKRNAERVRTSERKGVRAEGCVHL